MKKLIAMLGAVVAAVTSAWAGVATINGTSYETLQAAMQAASGMEDATIVLTEDITTSETIEMSCEFTLDFNGHKIIGTQEVDDSVIFVKGEIDFVDNSAEGNGGIESNCDGEDTVSVLSDDGDLGVYGGVFNARMSAVNGGEIWIDANYPNVLPHLFVETWDGYTGKSAKIELPKAMAETVYVGCDHENELTETVEHVNDEDYDTPVAYLRYSLAGYPKSTTVTWSNLDSDKGVDKAGGADVKLCLRATDEAPAGSTVKLTKIVIADRPNRDQTTPCYKLTIDGTDYYTNVRVAGDEEIVVNTAAAEASQIKRYTSIYTFAEGSEPTVTVGVVYDLATCDEDHTAQTGNARGGATCAQLEGANVNPATNGILWWNANVSTSSGWNILGEIYGEVTEVPSREPGDVYLKNNTPEYVLEDGTAVTELIVGDVIVIKSGKYSNVWSTTLDNVPSGYTIKFASDANLKSSIPNNTTIVCDSTVYLYGNIGANSNISGTGTLSVGWTGNQAAGTTEIAGGANIACKMLIQTDHVAKVNGSVTLGSVAGAGILEVAQGASIAGNNHFSSDWTGMVDLTNLTLSNGWNPANFGSTGSTVKLPEFSGHIAQVAEIPTTLELTGDVTLSNGYSPYTTTVNGIKGSGKFSVTANLGSAYQFKFKSVSGEVTFGVAGKNVIILPSSVETTVEGAVAKFVDADDYVHYCKRIDEALAGKTPGDDVSGVTVLGDSVTLPENWVTAGYTIDENGKIVAESSELPGEELIDNEEKEAYRDWASANDVTAETTTAPDVLAIAFHLGATISEGVMIEEAAQAKVKDLLKEIDLTALADLEGGEEAALDALNTKLAEKGLVADLDPVTLEGASESTKLYKLVIKLIEEN